LTLVDTNVLIDVLAGDAVWADRSTKALIACRARGPLAINETVYAELAAGFAGQAELDETISDMELRLMSMSRAALFLAGQAFRRYRAGGGSRTNVLADFFLGAQASVEEWPLLTRDHRLYRGYFADVALVPVA